MGLTNCKIFVNAALQAETGKRNRNTGYTFEFTLTIHSENLEVRPLLHKY